MTTSSLYDPAITLAAVERETILAALRYFDGNRTAAARALGISVRTLQGRLKQYRTEGREVPEPRCA